ncbi:putative baseplate assembly protein [Streptomyces sp. NPDC089799]|uniref:putative baseplate assembly protein n=1 Tax=Streptomyces sp. NPDC089799 TaxID=3155066 RepID=UPI00342F1419
MTAEHTRATPVPDSLPVPVRVPVSGSAGRARDARAAGRNGIEAVTVGPTRRRLTLILFGPAPEGLTPANFRIDGGVHARDLRVVAVAADLDLTTDLDPATDRDPYADPHPYAHAVREADRPGRIHLDLDRPGDISRYRLHLVAADPSGRPGTEPLPGFDPLFASAGFTFGQDCPAPADCKPEPAPPAAFAEPLPDYLAKDYESLRRTLLERLALTLPRWGERHAADLLVTLVELFAYAGDEIAWEQDAVAAEAHLDTARLRTSVRRHVRLVDHPMHEGCAARAVVCLSAAARVTLPAGTFRLRAGEQVFEPVGAGDTTVRPEHTRIALWHWGEPDFCLPAGTCSAALCDGEGAPDEGLRCDGEGAADEDAPGTGRLALAPGDILVLEEVLGAATGLPADADRTHRQAVRLVGVRRRTDPLYGRRLLEVTWAPEDALRFPLRVRAVGGPRCEPMETAVARGNAVLVEHGADPAFAGVPPQRVTWPSPPPGTPGCPCPPDFGCADEGTPAVLPAYPALPDRYLPVVPGDAGTGPAAAAPPVTWSVPYPLPEAVGRAQAARLDGLPDRARARLLALSRAAEAGTPPDRAALAWLETLFGARALARLRPAADPVAALRTLSSRFDELLHRKLARLAELARRARAGHVLRAADEGWEVGQCWGGPEGEALDPTRPALHGPLRPALDPDPRQALPAVRATEPPPPGGPRTSDEPWLPRRDLLDCGPADRCFVGEPDDDGLLHLRFGDGRNGARPAPGSVLELRFRLGNGTAGNVGAEAIDTVELRGLSGVTLRARNPLPATGGTDPEPVAAVRAGAPHEAARRLLRAVGEQDYAALAGQVPGVQRADARLRWTGSWYEAQVAVDALGTAEAPARLTDGVREALHRVRRIGHEVYVGPARQVPLRLALCLTAEPTAVAGHVRAAVARVLGSGLLPDGTRGLFHADELTFGTPVRVSRIVAAAAAVPGVRSVRVTALERLFEPSGEALRDGILRLRPGEIARLDADPVRPEHGVLELLVGGGR